MEYDQDKVDEMTLALLWLTSFKVPGGVRALVVGIVRRPDPVPCPNCAVGEWDMCRNGRYTDRSSFDHKILIDKFSD